MHSFTARSPRHNFFAVLRRHIFPRPSALKHFPDTPFPLHNPHFPPYPFLFPHFPLPTLFYSRKRINIHSLTLSPPHPLTLSPPHFSLFTSLIFYPFTFKNLIFPLPFYLFTLLIFIFSHSCSFPLIVKKYLSSVIFIPIYLSCFHKSINSCRGLVEIRHVPPDMEVLLYF